MYLYVISPYIFTEKYSQVSHNISFCPKAWLELASSRSLELTLNLWSSASPHLADADGHSRGSFWPVSGLASERTNAAGERHHFASTKSIRRKQSRVVILSCSFVRRPDWISQITHSPGSPEVGKQFFNCSRIRKFPRRKNSWRQSVSLWILSFLPF